MIEAIDLTKEFKTPIKKPGLGGAIAHLFHGEYKTKLAVDHVNFSIDQGEAVAYIGPNGAGKSTTIKMLTGILKPTAGEIRIDGIDPQKNRIQNAKNIGVVFGQRTQLWWDIPIEESFTLLKSIYEIPESVYQENLALFHEIFGLSEFLGQPARRLSLGQRMRADLAAALLHNPSTVFLDEPTIGLDIGTKEAMRELIQKINRERGVTIILTSHDLKDVENICRRIIVIDDGQIICDKEIETLTREYSMNRGIQITLSQGAPDLPGLLRAMEGISHVSMENDSTLRIDFSPEQHTAFEIVKEVNNHAQIQDFKLIEPSIEHMIEVIYRSGEVVK